MSRKSPKSWADIELPRQTDSFNPVKIGQTPTQWPFSQPGHRNISPVKISVTVIKFSQVAQGHEAEANMTFMLSQVT